MAKKFLRFRKRYAVHHRKEVHGIKRAARHPAVAVPFMTISLLLFLSVVIILIISGGNPQFKTSDTHVVILTHDDIERAVPTRERTVGDVLKKAEVSLNEGDVVEPGIETEVVSDNFRINVYRALPVTIVDGRRKIFTYSAAKTPRSIVKQAGIEVHPEDRLDLIPPDNFLIEGSIGERVVVKRATAVNLNLYGTQFNLRTQAKTVEELLKEKNVKLSEGDTVQPALNSFIVPNSQVFVLRQGIKIEFAEEKIPMPRQIIEDAGLSFGTVVTRQQGTTGKRLVTYQIDTNTGERKRIQEVTIVEAVPEIIARGKAVKIPGDKQSVMRAAGIAVSDYPYVDFIMSHEAGWCPTKLQGQIGYCPAYAPEYIPPNLGYGIGQATPGTKMAPYGADWKTNVVTQLKWARAYVKGRYGNWANAYNFWQNHRYW